MTIYNRTDCIVFLTGYLETMPVMMLDYSTNFIISVLKNKSSPSYRVIINKHDAIRLLNYGYLGICIIVEGSLTLDVHSVIFAKKITFLDTSDPDTSSAQNKIDCHILPGLQNKFLNQSHLLH